MLSDVLRTALLTQQQQQHQHQLYLRADRMRPTSSSTYNDAQQQQQHSMISDFMPVRAENNMQQQLVNARGGDAKTKNAFPLASRKLVCSIRSSRTRDVENKGQYFY